MLDHPVFVRMPTEDEKPYFANKSSAENVISVLIAAQRQDWLRLHGFVILPEALEMVMTPIKQGVAGVVAHLQAETIPLLTVLLPEAGMVWARQVAHVSLTTQRALDARLQMMLLVPVANGISETAADYAYSSANPRYTASVTVFTGFQKHSPEGAGLSQALNAGRAEESTPASKPDSGETPPL